MTPRLPDAFRFAVWFTAWCRGRTSLDEARDHVVDDDADHLVAGLHDAPEPLVLALGRLRARGGTHATVSLPVPGDPVGLAGPAEFNREALAAGEAVLVVGAGVGLVPHRTGAGVLWQSHDAAPPAAEDVRDANRWFRRALLDATDDLASLDVARWRPDVADALMDLRRGVGPALPPGVPPEVCTLVADALRARTVAALALEDHGGALTAQQARRRREALLPLDHAARRALVAACSGNADR